jgi:hypothetical protein
MSQSGLLTSFVLVFTMASSTDSFLARQAEGSHRAEPALKVLQAVAPSPQVVPLLGQGERSKERSWEVNATVSRKTGKVVRAIGVSIGESKRLRVSYFEALTRQWLFEATGEDETSDVIVRYIVKPAGTTRGEQTAGIVFLSPTTVEIRLEESPGDE